MYFVILGAGEVGIRIAQILSGEGHEVILIEKDRNQVAHIYNRVDCRLILDEGTRSDVLESAEIHRADYFIAASNRDEINLITCLLVQKIAPHVKNISRMRNQNYMLNSKESIFPIDYVVHPEREAALSVIRSIEIGGGASDVFTFKNFGDIAMRNFFIDSDSKFVDEELKNIYHALAIPNHLISQFLIVLINRQGEAIIPTGTFVFQEGDEIYFVGRHSILEELLLFLGKKVRAAKNIRKILMLGATPIAEQIIDCYHNARENRLFSITGKRRFVSKDITIIEDDLAKCEQISDKYPEITVIHADITHEDVLADLELGQTDMLVATTNEQEKNIVLAAHSHNLGVPHTIALVRTPVYFNIAAELGISMSLSVRTSVVTAILGFIRGQTSLYSLAEGSFSIVECDVHPKSNVVYKAINSINLPPKCLIVCISNKKGSLITHGNTVIQPEDRVLCISHPESISKLNVMFAKTREED